MDILLNILWEAQEKHGYLSEEVMKEISIKHDIPIARLYAVASFYTMLKLEEQGKNVIEMCSSPPCILNNGALIEAAITKELGISPGETTSDKKFSYYKVSCIGQCDKAPAMLINGRPCTRLTEDTIIKEIRKLK
ncbi:MAG: NAD(P)H-dependent oxidoreductase subunit E [Candidatus Woesearchaeota archaeon]